MNKITHFGLDLIKRKYEFNLIREQYAIINNRNSFFPHKVVCKSSYTDEAGRFYTDEWCINHQKDCLKNYDLSMKYFSLLDKNEFDEEIKHFLLKNKSFKEVTNLNEYNHISGCYIMVLDEYKQLYIGVSNDIVRRIRQHWSKNKQFDRLLFPIGAVETSVMSIDSFRALDTKRIYIRKTNTGFDDEDKYIKYFSPKFICNRMGGGKFEDSLSMSIYALITKKSRDLSISNQ